ncbi:hypothetical protein DPMN_063494 [Dreissena polymorpha]|uniref:Uncharacterized protein n=1 Tax=Dreissena polymorpha TaxID=45954 RepID=A0A9D4CBG0_DREPO|nr:hypothetical protein DPMN_063494 [Dreissena polymorpha]
MDSVTFLRHPSIAKRSDGEPVQENEIRVGRDVTYLFQQAISVRHGYIFSLFKIYMELIVREALEKLGDK